MSTVYTPSSVYHTSATVPSDGDPRSAASVNSPIEAALDNAQWCHDRIPNYFTPTMYSVQTLGDQTAAQIGNLMSTAAFADMYTGLVNIVSPVLKVGDVIEWWLTAVIQVNTASGIQLGINKIQALDSQNGGAFARIPGATFWFGDTIARSGTTTVYLEAALYGQRTITTQGSYVVKLQGSCGNGASGNQFAFYDSGNFTFRYYRLGGISQ